MDDMNDGAGYLPRIADGVIEDALRRSRALAITGIRWCGKTATARRFAASEVLPVEGTPSPILADPDAYRIPRTEGPVLPDGWRHVPGIWDEVKRFSEVTGPRSILIDSVEGAIPSEGMAVRIRMRTMSLFESGLSAGDVSLRSLFDGRDRVLALSNLEYADIAGAIVRGGWPGVIGLDDSAARGIVEGYCEAIVGGTAVEGAGRHGADRMRAVMRSLSRNTAAAVPATRILADAAADGAGMSRNTMYACLRSLRDQYVVDDLPAWCPGLRTATLVRTSGARHLADPSIAAYFMGMGRGDILRDPDAFGCLFASMVVRDLRVYAMPLGGEVRHYRDADGLEVDAVVLLGDGRWGAVQARLTDQWADKAARSLTRLRDKVDPAGCRPPSFLMVVTGRGVARTRPDGVHVVPIGCLRDRGHLGPFPQVHAGGRSLPMAGAPCLLTLRVPSGTSRKSASSWSVG